VDRHRTRALDERAANQVVCADKMPVLRSAALQAARACGQVDQNGARSRAIDGFIRMMMIGVEGAIMFAQWFARLLTYTG